jgi:hypothetical protein
MYIYYEQTVCFIAKFWEEYTELQKSAQQELDKSIPKDSEGTESHWDLWVFGLHASSSILE